MYVAVISWNLCLPIFVWRRVVFFRWTKHTGQCFWCMWGEIYAMIGYTPTACGIIGKESSTVTSDKQMFYVSISFQWAECPSPSLMCSAVFVFYSNMFLKNPLWHFTYRLAFGLLKRALSKHKLTAIHGLWKVMEEEWVQTRDRSKNEKCKYPL